MLACTEDSTGQPNVSPKEIFAVFDDCRLDGFHSNAAMTEENYSFRCRKYKPNADGTVRHYVLEIVDRESEETQELLITPRELVSPISMKRILMGQRILYSTTKKKHDEMLKEIFCNPPSAA